MPAASVSSKEEQLAAHNLFLLTTKPVLYVCNVDENSAKEGNEYSRQIEKIAAEEGAEAMIIAAKTEEDIASLESYEDKSSSSTNSDWRKAVSIDSSRRLTTCSTSRHSSLPARWK